LTGTFILVCPRFSNLRSLAASLRLFTLSHSQICRLAYLHFRADLCPRCAILTSCDLCVSMIGTTYLYLPVGGFYKKICTRPTSCKFDLKSATCSQMTKRTSCDLFSATCSQMTTRTFCDLFLAKVEVADATMFPKRRATHLGVHHSRKKYNILCANNLLIAKFTRPTSHTSNTVYKLNKSKLSGLVNVFTMVQQLVCWWWCCCCLFLCQCESGWQREHRQSHDGIR